MRARLHLEGAAAFWTATGLAALSLVLVIVNGILFQSNEAVRSDVNQRQLDINKWFQEARQNQDLLQMLAVAAVRNNNAAARALLARNGYNIVVNQPAADGSAAPAPATNAPAPPANPPLRKP
jgi:hypothetical protein